MLLRPRGLLAGKHCYCGHVAGRQENLSSVATCLLGGRKNLDIAATWPVCRGNFATVATWLTRFFLFTATGATQEHNKKRGKKSPLSAAPKRSAGRSCFCDHMSFWWENCSHVVDWRENPPTVAHSLLAESQATL